MLTRCPWAPLLEIPLEWMLVSNVISKMSCGIHEHFTAADCRSKESEVKHTSIYQALTLSATVLINVGLFFSRPHISTCFSSLCLLPPSAPSVGQCSAGRGWGSPLVRMFTQRRVCGTQAQGPETPRTTRNETKPKLPSHSTFLPHVHPETPLPAQTHPNKQMQCTDWTYLLSSSLDLCIFCTHTYCTCPPQQ